MWKHTNAAQLDSAEAKPRGHDACHTYRNWCRTAPGERPSITTGNLIHFVVAVFFLWPIFLFVAVVWSLGDAVNFVRHSTEACISSTFWLGRLAKEWTAGMYLHRRSPQMLRLRGQRKAFGVEALKDWREAGRALRNVGRAWSKTFGLGGLFSSLESRIQKANNEWRRYVATAAYDNSEAPPEFPEQYEVVDELPRGGSSARLYVVRRKDETRGPLFVLKYFNLRDGGNLENVVRESEAAKLAKRLGLILESKIGDNSFWYVMPYYHGETLTGGVMRNIKRARENDELAEHYRVSLGYVHQLLKVIARYHEAGVFHKDIKPDNLIINGERIYLVDIGLMTPLTSMAQLTTHGTEYFRDPEMVRLALDGREVREVDAAKFDVYSIGAVLFFALSGEFPTSGALSRVPREVPTAAQWVVNRAMTAMHQRYADARAMLADVDYLCWAASRNALNEVKPADLPSFRGAPVVPAETTPAHWVGAPNQYSAPAHAAPGAKSSFLRTAVIVLVCLAAVAFSWFAFTGGPHHWRSTAEAPPAAEDSLASRLPDELSGLVPVYEQIDRDIAAGIRTESVTGAPVERVELAPEILYRVESATSAWADDIRREWSKGTRNGPESILDDLHLVFVHVDPDESDRELAAGLERELTLEAARRGHKATPPGDSEALRRTVMNVSDRQALHRELGARFARVGAVPPFLVAFTIEHEDGKRHVDIRTIYPGREQGAKVPSTSTTQD